MSQLSPASDDAALALHAEASLSAESVCPAQPGRLADLATLTKPRITVMVAITAYIGYALAPASGASWLPLFWAMVGTSLSCMGASVLNQVYERDTDGLMNRTRDRPLPAGRQRPAEALVLGLVLSIAGVLMLGLGTYWLAAGLSAFTILSYALVYTPLKRMTTLSLLIGAVPGAMPPVIGYAAASGDLGLGAGMTFLIMFVWQVPHFLAIAWLYREDYARAGLVMLPVIDPSGRRTFHQILISCMMMLPLGLLPTYLGMSGLLYFATAMACGAGFLWCGIALVLQPTRQRARLLFLASLVYLPVVLAMLLLDQA